MLPSQLYRVCILSDNYHLCHFLPPSIMCVCVCVCTDGWAMLIW